MPRETVEPTSFSTFDEFVIRNRQYEVRQEARRVPNGAFDAQGLGSIPEIKLESEWGSSTLRPGASPAPPRAPAVRYVVFCGSKYEF
jgi:hypothetical protein